MVTYEQWNKAIISYFFENCEPGQIVFLQTNAETLDEIAERFDFNVSDAADSLKIAVQNKAVVRGAINFWAMNPTLWKDYSQEEPPQVAFLALTVFAASLMESEGSVASHNYYSRLNEVLFGRVIKGTPQGFNRDEFENFWKHLRKWAIDQHDVVLYLTEGASKRRYVWYPISQCLISNRDRRDVYSFFRARGLTPFSKIRDKQFEKDLQVWLQSSDGSARIKRYFSNESYKKSIFSQVKSLLKHWDGEIPPEPLPGERQTISLIRVEFQFNQSNNINNQSNNINIRFWFLRRGRDEINCETNSLGVKCLQTFNSEKWFRPISDNNGTFLNLNNILQLRTDETKPITYILNSSDIWVFRKDQECDNGWISQRSMELYEDHWILFRKRLFNQVTACLKLTCGPEVEKPKSIDVSGKPNGWFYLQATPTTLKHIPDSGLWKLSVDSNKQICLVGGLSIKGEDGHRTYLDICLPSVSLPDIGNSEDLLLQTDDQSFPVGENRLVRLENKLGVGIHQLSYGKKTRELRVTAPDRSLKHQEKTLTIVLSEDQETIPTYSVETTAEIAEKPGSWLAGTKFLGTDIPEVTWDDVKTKPPTQEKDVNQSFKSPARLISLIVKLAIELKFDKASVPEWFNEAIKCIDQNAAMRTLIEKKLQHYHEMALSYADLRKYIDR